MLFLPFIVRSKIWMPVGKKSTLIKISFFGLLLAALIGMQYMWIQNLQKVKLNVFKGRAISGIEAVGSKMMVGTSFNTYSDSTFAKALGQSFSTNGLGKLRFEYAIDLDDRQLASRGYTEKQTQTSNNL